MKLNLQDKSLFKKTLLKVWFLYFVVSCGNIPSNLTPTASVTSSPKPSSTPTLTLTPTSTPTEISFSSLYNFPEWMSKPNYNILIGITSWENRNYQFSLFGEKIYNTTQSPDNAERYDIVLPSDIIGYFWLDTNTFGFLDKSKEKIYLFDMLTGYVSIKNIPLSSTRFLKFDQPDFDMVMDALIASTEDAENENFLIINSKDRWLFSENWRFKAEYIRPDKESKLRIIDLKSDSFFDYDIYPGDLPERFDGSEFFRISWSPTIENQIAIIQGKGSPRAIVGETLKVIDANTGKTQLSLSGEFQFRLDWSYDGSSVIYYLADDYQHPCFFNLNGSNQCSNYPFNTENPSFEQKYSTYQFSQLSNELSAYIIYFPDYIIQRTAIPPISMLGKFCIFNISTQDSYCPLHGLDTTYQLPREYSLSPDNRFVVLEQGYTGASAHFIVISQHILLPLSKDSGIQQFQRLNSMFYEVPRPEIEGSPIFYHPRTKDFLWRPLD